MKDHLFGSMGRRLLCMAALAFSLISCVDIDHRLGQSYLATGLQYDVYTEEFPIEDIEMQLPDSVSGFSLYRFTVGAIRDEYFGLTTRSAAFTLVPMDDSLDLGKPGTRVFKSFHFAAVTDSVSIADPDQANILQNINVYALTEPIDFSSSEPVISYDATRRITKGIPVYDGRDSLSFDFTREFGERFLNITQHDLDTITNYTKRFPGIYLTVDTPVGIGGRINMFKIPLDVQNGYVFGSGALLNFTAEFDSRGPIDTSAFFYLGPINIYDLSGVNTTTPSTHPQLSYNKNTHESQNLQGPVSGDKFYIEGGNGVKPVIKAAPLRKKLNELIARHGDPALAVINKATLEFPFEFPDDYTLMYRYPTILSPTCRIVSDEGKTSYAGLSDASVSTENQGNINRSLCVYAPDVTHHAQELLKLSADEKITNYDIWLFATATEIVSTTNSNSNSAEMNEYMQNLMYQSYYNSMYGGYGGYGGYGYGGYGYGGYGGYGYDSYYNNIYTYALMAQIYNNSGTKTSTQDLMDFNRYYCAVMDGPAAARKPVFRVTYSIPKEN